ncbi:hypothetical protein LINPERPRIM_LOCUS13531 [Linum perenne]
MDRIIPTCSGSDSTCSAALSSNSAPQVSCLAPSDHYVADPTPPSWLRKICKSDLLSPARVVSFRKIQEDEAAKLVREIGEEASGNRLLEQGGVNLSKKLIVSNDESFLLGVACAELVENLRLYPLLR